MRKCGSYPTTEVFLRILLASLAVSMSWLDELNLGSYLCRLAHFLPNDLPFASFVLFDRLPQGLALDGDILEHDRSKLVGMGTSSSAKSA